MLVDWILSIANKGFPFTKDVLLDSVQLLIKKMNRQNPFTNGRPGRHWFEAFMKRHPQLSLRTPQNLCERRGQVSEGKIREWFKQIEDYLKSNNLLDIDSSRIFNCDESAFFLNPKGNKVITNKKSKGIYNLVDANDKECITTLITGNAAGELLPPMIMFSYQRLPSSIIDKVPPDWSVGKFDNGWMTGESFYEYMTNVFYPWCIKKEIKFPIIMYLDGHSSHATMALSDFCVEHEIEIISLYPNSTHITQPMDVALFRPLKEAWKKAVTDWRMQNGGKAVKKQNFAPVLQTALHSLNVKNILTQGFIACGLAPLSADAVNYEKLLNHDQLLQQKNLTNMNSSTSSHNNYECTLTFIEDYIDDKTVQLFKVAEGRDGKWYGEEKYEVLFSIWLECRKLMLNKSAGMIEKRSIETSSVLTV
ncbi:MFS-type transporter clz9-like [Osmia bicornis bicornis]|uniref:MFS-type transporter clz9-like n=1 Tax=Osmia bicornis bicornis TaxID=1437191 RepID=UPI001EAF6BC0|nr:MFS-type transporter clz9-like [Osmia bicornis bicornis]